MLNKESSYGVIGKQVTKQNLTSDEELIITLAKKLGLNNSKGNLKETISNYSVDKANDSHAKYRFTASAFDAISCAFTESKSKDEGVILQNSILYVSIVVAFLTAAQELLKNLLNPQSQENQEGMQITKKTETKPSSLKDKLKDKVFEVKDKVTTIHHFDEIGSLIPDVLSKLSLAFGDKQIDKEIINKSNIISFIELYKQKLNNYIAKVNSNLIELDKIKLKFIEQVFIHLNEKGNQKAVTKDKIETLHTLYLRLYLYIEDNNFNHVKTLLQYCNNCINVSRDKGSGERAQALEIITSEFRDNLVGYLINNSSALKLDSNQWMGIYNLVTHEGDVSIKAFAIIPYCAETGGINVLALDLLQKVFIVPTDNLRHDSFVAHIQKYIAQISETIKQLLLPNSVLTPEIAITAKAYAAILNYCLYTIEKAGSKDYQDEEFPKSAMAQYFIDRSTYILDIKDKGTKDKGTKDIYINDKDIIDHANKLAVEIGLIGKDSTVFPPAIAYLSKQIELAQPQQTSNVVPNTAKLRLEPTPYGVIPPNSQQQNWRQPAAPYRAMPPLHQNTTYGQPSSGYGSIPPKPSSDKPSSEYGSIPPKPSSELEQQPKDEAEQSKNEQTFSPM